MDKQSLVDKVKTGIGAGEQHAGWMTILPASGNGENGTTKPG
jgi:hypothetical protein